MERFALCLVLFHMDIVVLVPFLMYGGSIGGSVCLVCFRFLGRFHVGGVDGCLDGNNTVSIATQFL